MDFWVGIGVSVLLNLVKDRRNRAKFYGPAAKVLRALTDWANADPAFMAEVERQNGNK